MALVCSNCGKIGCDGTNCAPDTQAKKERLNQDRPRDPKNN